MASCIQIEGMLQSYMDDEVSTSERLLIEEHLKSCEMCASRFQMTRATAASVFDVLRQYHLQEDFTSKVMAHLPDIPPAVSINESLRQQAFNERGRTRRWFLNAVRLIPVVMPLILFVMAGLLWFAWPSNIAGSVQALGMIMHSDGSTVKMYTDQGQEDRMHARDNICAGDIFETGDEGRLLLGLMGPSHITVFENSVVQVRAPRVIVLEKGRVFFDVFREARQFQVHTPDGRITVFGTSFQVDIQSGGTEVTVANGEVMVENDTDFLRLHRNTQVLFNSVRKPIIRTNIDATPYVQEARVVRPDAAAEHQFLTRIVNDAPSAQAIPAEQVFVVETGGRPVSALLLKWTPDPYATGHAGYNVYVSDSSMLPLFKIRIASSTFQDKEQSEVRIATPAVMRNHEMETLHITIMPEINYGQVETTFTEVAAIGGTS